MTLSRELTLDTDVTDALRSLSGDTVPGIRLEVVERCEDQAPRHLESTSANVGGQVLARLRGEPDCALRPPT